MFRRIGCVLGVIVIFLLAVSCTNKEKQELILAKSSYVRWYEADQLLEVYTVVVNQSNKVQHIRGKVVMLYPGLIKATGIERLEVTTDDRHETQPFTVNPNEEIVLRQSIRTNLPLTQRLLKSGVAMELGTDDMGFLIPIPYGEIH
ncbi:hypothetical protein A8990_12026 [Paenibacillus taihuensis]|uniref:Lipoprotein n=1 Tax=Paenibacillus taihuensis TaxID=1156355 RepID=A0A3D9RM58_9BACL|nr:hypothetical protein [Paenibacillus taihuensis]REE80980.1 hypothetical protein A8990_12026 [Paenibacillus taihuensis]